MPVIILPESEMGIELARWNKPYRFERYPAMLYKARKRPDGVISCSEGSDSVFGGHPGVAESWSVGCQRIVNDDTEYENAKREGWRDSPTEALDYHKALDKAISDAAAHRNYEDRSMSRAAKAEADAHETGQFEHVPEIPETPVRRRGRPRKNQVQ